MIEEARSRANAILLRGELATQDFCLVDKAIVESHFKPQAMNTVRPQQRRSHKPRQDTAYVKNSIWAN